MLAALAYLQGTGPLFWNSRKALFVGILAYLIGFVSQFYWVGWVVADLLLPIGLTLCCMAIFRVFEAHNRLKSVMGWLGARSYSYFLIHNFVIDRTINLVVHKSLPLYYLLLPVMVIGTLLLATAADYITPTLQRLAFSTLKEIDAALTTFPKSKTHKWNSSLGDRA
jgi:peptidoglycan/LPS O-acetylase OafA/YrhL